MSPELWGLMALSAFAGCLVGVCAVALVTARNFGSPPQPSDRQMLERAAATLKTVSAAPYQSHTVSLAHVVSIELDAYLARTASAS